jgi:N-methylhydantoinase A/oxoprolinase/acetone carboxylase beta subunit
MTVVDLGIDTGGTYTDAVLVDHDAGTVLASAKSLTTRHDLSIGIGEAVRAVLAQAKEGALTSSGPAPSAGSELAVQGAVSPDDVSLVALSTTLATNAIVEGQGSPVCLLLIGYDPELIQRYGFERDLVTKDVVYLRGGHDGLGDEVAPLDEAAAREAILARRDKVEAFAVSGYFGVRNPEHELQVRALVEELAQRPDGSPMPVTCGHELTTRLNAVRRATTTALNARLIPLLQDLIATVRRTLDQLGISAPLMVVKGDGSLVRAGWAMQRPIETILSGPAASVVGAWHLAQRGDVWVVDVGGTTTDIAALVEGHPRLNPEGAQVGQWRTMVQAVDVHTVGLGGDSQVRVHGLPSSGRGWLTVGPRRVVPLSLLASLHPEVVRELLRQTIEEWGDNLVGQFVLAQREPEHVLSEDDREIVAELAKGPQSLIGLSSRLRYSFMLSRQLEGLRSRRLILHAGFTPTDALHVLGKFQLWDTEAAKLGAKLLAAQAGLEAEEFCRHVAEKVSDRVATELISKVLSDEATKPDWEAEPAATALLARALNGSQDSGLACRLTLKNPVVAIGAPVEAYLPRTSGQLNTELVIPDYAGVANAVGAVAGGVVQQVRAIIHQLDDESGYRLHLPDGVHDFETLKESVAYAQERVPEQIKALAHQAGADQVEVKMVREDRTAPVKGGWGSEIYLSTELLFTAVGRPSIARDA